MEKFCHDMETTPVGVIVGLFQAISQKLPSFSDWDTSKHHHLLHSNPDVCNTMTEVRQHVEKFGKFPPFPKWKFNPDGSQKPTSVAVQRQNSTETTLTAFPTNSSLDL